MKLISIKKGGEKQEEEEEGAAVRARARDHTIASQVSQSKSKQIENETTDKCIHI